MDHALRTISYIADIGDLVVLMARRRLLPSDDPNTLGKQPKMICHVFESDEVGVFSLFLLLLLLPSDDPNTLGKQPRMICHVFESDEVGRFSFINDNKSSWEVVTMTTLDQLKD